MASSVRLGLARRLGLRVAFCLPLLVGCGGNDDSTNPLAQGGQPGGGGSAGNSGGSTSASGGASAGSSVGGTLSGGGSVGSGGSTSSGGTVASGGVGGRPTSACAGLALEENVPVADFDTDRFSWNDASCQPRQAAMVRVGGGYVRQFVYQAAGAARTATGTGVNGHTGWGYTVDHFGNSASLGKGLSGTFTPLFVGTHHAIYEYEFTQVISGQNVPITLHWFFATGRNNPVLGITYDMTGLTAGSLVADIRTPYGDIAWDGDDNASSTVVSGVGWGDRYRFITTAEPLTMNSTWDYSQPNTVPYVLEWTTGTNAEMGAVQTQIYAQHDAGGYWYYSNWGKTSDNHVSDGSQVGLMPSTWNWTYQLNQYELCIENASCVNNTTGSHRLAWGTNYGALGGATAGSGMYAAYGDDKQLSGYPYQSYSVFMVLGEHTATPVFNQVAEIETVQKTTLTASTGTVPTMGPGGVGRSDMVALSPAGYDARYSVWTAEAASNQLALTATVSEGTLVNPVLVVGGYSAANAPSVSVNGTALTPDVDYVVSLDAAGQKAWITFRVPWTGTTTISVTGT